MLAAFAIFTFLTVVAAQPQPQCRLSIPDSGGASLRPELQNGAPIFASFAVPSDAFNCSPAACEAFACASPGAFAWGWTVAGSAHQVCGGVECDLFVAASSDWPAAASSLALIGGYNYAGYVWATAAAKALCCPAANASSASPAPLAPPAPPGNATSGAARRALSTALATLAACALLLA